MSWYWSCSIHNTSGRSEGSGFYCQECARVRAEVDTAKNRVVDAARHWFGVPDDDKDADHRLEAAVLELERLENKHGIKPQ